MFSLATQYDAAKHGHLDLYVQFKRRGVRCVWHQGEFWTRNRKNDQPKLVQALDHLKPYMPQDTTDGELYVHGWSQGRINGAVNSHTLTDDKRQLEFWAFDHPFKDGIWIHRKPADGDEKAPFYRVMRTDMAFAGKHTEWIELAKRLAFEGVVFRTLTCLPVFGRNSTILKEKPLIRAKYLCVDVLEGKKGKTGRQLGRVGALVLQTAEGQKFNVGRGWSAHQAEVLWEAPPIGQQIIIEYKDEDEGIPQEATFLRACAILPPTT